MNISPLISYFHSFPPIIFSLFTFLAGYCALIILAYLYGKSGIYCYLVMAILMANIQVLKTSQFSFFSSPVALGTELFATSYLATDILAEVFNKKSAQKAVMLGFIALIIWTVFSLLTLSFRPISSDTIQTSLETIFLPIPRFLIASIIAYFISQNFDVYVFSFLKKRHKNKKLWIRNNISTILSSLIDNIVFSIIAFWLLNPESIKIRTLIMTYILGTYVFRIVAALLDTPIIYILCPILKKKFSQPSLSSSMSMR